MGNSFLFRAAIFSIGVLYAQQELEQRYPRYQLRPLDVLIITFSATPEFDQTVTVQPDGYIALRGAGDLHVQSKSVPEVKTLLGDVYKKILHEPVINVELKEFEKPYFIAGGEFGKPGKYELRGDTTVAEAVAIAGGYTDRAKHSQILVFRRVPNGWLEAKRVDIKAMMNRQNLSEDIQVRSGDLIFVPKSVFSKVRQFIPSSGFSIPGVP